MTTSLLLSVCFLSLLSTLNIVIGEIISRKEGNNPLFVPEVLDYLILGGVVFSFHWFGIVRNERALESFREFSKIRSHSKGKGLLVFLYVFGSIFSFVLTMMFA